MVGGTAIHQNVDNTGQGEPVATISANEKVERGPDQEWQKNAARGRRYFVPAQSMNFGEEESAGQKKERHHRSVCEIPAARSPSLLFMTPPLDFLALLVHPAESSAVSREFTRSCDERRKLLKINACALLFAVLLSPLACGAQTNSPSAALHPLSPADAKTLRAVTTIVREEFDWARQQGALLDQRTLELHIDQVLQPDSLADQATRQTAREKLDALQAIIAERAAMLDEASRRMKQKLAGFDPKVQKQFFVNYDAGLAERRKFFEKHLATEAALDQKFRDILDLCDTAPGGVLVQNGQLVFADHDTVDAFNKKLEEIRQLAAVDQAEASEAAETVTASQGKLDQLSRRANQ